ncbi:MAG: thiol reductant ABC exporter subunit CydD [Geobacteraceae bacterium GWC2_53_11]|nr:MAG: thiol reductant ABC exporter subunit CydD [Geobacteraceae bacterium GWC2_53_11]
MTDLSEESVDSTPKNTGAERWLFAEAKKVRGLLFAVVALSAVIGVLVVAQARLLATACQRVVIQGEGVESVTSLALTLVLVAVGRSMFSWILEHRSSAAAARVKQAVRSRLYRKIQALGPAGLGGSDTASLIETVTKGVDELEPYFTRFLPHAVLAALLPLMFLVIIVPSEWRAGLVLLFSAPCIPFFMILIGRGSEKLHRRQWSRLSRMAGHLLDLVQGLPDLIIFGAAKREAAVIARVSEEYRSATMSVLRLAFLSAFALEFFATVGTAVVAVIVGFRLLSGNLSLGEGLFVLLMAPEFYLPLRNLGLSYHARMQGVAAAERIAPLLATPDPEGFSGILLPSPGPPAVRFEGVSFRYGGVRGGVSGADLELPAGSCTALVGESGAGKSTLARLLIGLARPERGRILINGHDLTLLAPDAWRSCLAWVPQAPYFTSGTVRENLLLGRPDASEYEISDALEAAAATQFVSRLPHGLDTILGEQGAGLSGGELRRLALARAYLCKATLVVLDEPTAGLDPENERLVGEALARLSMGRTVLVISHREQTLIHVDRIAEMVDGRIDRVVSPFEFLKPSEAAA